MNSLGTLGGTQSVAMDINDSGQVVGGAQDGSDNMRPFRWANGTMSDLGTLGGESAAVTHRAEAINGSGHLVGQSNTAGGAAHAFYYDGSMTDLGVLTGGSQSWALGISDGNVVVGTSDVTGGAFHAFVWDATNGMRDLNNLDDGTWTLTRATDINASGQITGWGTNPGGDVRAFLLTPACSAGGGASARIAPPLASGLGVINSSGWFEAAALDADGYVVAEIFVEDADEGATVEYVVTKPDRDPNVPRVPVLPTLEGFPDGVALDITLDLKTSMTPGTFAATVVLVTGIDELAEAGLKPNEAELYVLDTTRPPPGIWVPTGKNIGGAMPTGAVGDSGFVEYADGGVDYWAVVDKSGTFAIGRSPQLNEVDPEPGAVVPVPRMCGFGMIQPVFVGLTMLFVLRRARPLNATDEGA